MKKVKPQHLEPYCRLCGHRLKAMDGCDSCLSAKKHFVYPEETGDRVTTQELTQRTARIMREQIARLTLDQGREHKYDAQLSRELVNLTKALSGLVSEMRRLDEKQEANLASMGYAERCDLIAQEFFARLPEEYQVDFIQKLTRLYNEMKLPVYSELEAVN